MIECRQQAHILEDRNVKVHTIVSTFICSQMWLWLCVCYISIVMICDHRL